VIPATHAAENQKLQADAYVDLFEIALVPSGLILVKNNDTITWQGKTFDGFAIQLTGAAKSTDGRRARPALTFPDPDGIFSPYVDSGALDKALVTRKRVLRADLDANRNVYQARTWRVGRVASHVPGTQVALELRELSDGPLFVIPGRQFLPPAFPVVSLG
jgi:phage-related protein